MQKIYKFNKKIIFFIIFFFICSTLTIYSASQFLNSNLLIKQIIWYILGIILIFIIAKIKNKYIYDNNKILYLGTIILLSLLLLFAPSINGSKCWFVIPGIGNFQPSEFMKIFLIITLANEINDFNKNKKTNFKNELIFILKIFIITLIPSILTFLEPDTGAVIIYMIIAFIMLFTSKIRKRWFIIIFAIIISILSFIFYLYFFNKDLFINIFSTELFYRLERIMSWTNNTSYQLENALISQGSSNLLGYGIKNLPLYFPEPATDFIFATFTTTFGYIAGIVLIIMIFLFDKTIIEIILKSKEIDKYVAIGILAMLMYQQIQNIGMNIGLLPITGITLPFMSYGGSSTLSYMLALGIILNIDKGNQKI